MLIVHFCITPMAGAPISLVQALQRHTDLNVRLVDLYRWGIYDHDIVFSENPDDAIDAANKANIIHFHNYLDLNSNDFYPIDFKALRQKGTFFIKHFHSTPNLVAGRMGVSKAEILDSSIPSLVIAQFQERYYPKAQVVPNIISNDLSTYRTTKENHKYGIFFSPTTITGAWKKRWNTKGLPETLLAMELAAFRAGSKLKLVTNATHHQVLSEMQKAKIVVNDIVTGSYHLTALEGLSLGKPVLNYLDSRSSQVLRSISGSEVIPFINVMLEDAASVAIHLLQHKNQTEEIGQAGQKWIDKYWSEENLVEHYIDIYEKLLFNPALIKRQKELSLDNETALFYAVKLPDIIHSSRADHFSTTFSLIAKFYLYMKVFFLKLKLLYNSFLSLLFTAG